MKKVIVIILIFIGILGGIYLFNYFNLQAKLNNVISEDYRNSGISISVYYRNYVDLNIVVFDLRKNPYSKSRADVFRVLLQFADKIKNEDYDSIVLSFKGEEKFMIKGYYFKKLGDEYSYQNPVYTMRTFTENVYYPSGIKAFSEWTGGWLGVVSEQINDFNEFHEKWYGNSY